jgi:uncharacterized protein (TIGR02145 family)
MRTLHGKLFFPLIAVVIVLIFSNGCKKNNDSNNPIIPSTGSTVTDIDGNIYHTITIGTQTWTVENLRTTKFRNSHPITNISDSLQWTGLTTPGYCDYNNDVAMAAIYGHLYNWSCVTDTNNLAPAGWHIPTDAEWTILTTYLGTGAGGKLKATGTTYWNIPNAGATNETGFTGLPGGDRSNTGLFHYLGTYGCFWCATESTATEAWEYVLSANTGNVTRMQYSKNIGLSVRCVKD